MRKILALAAALASAATSFSIPSLASAQEWRGDPCREARHEAGRNGTVAGGLFGALVGSQVAGRGNRAGGAIVGGTIGAVAGHNIGASSVRCDAYPRGYHNHAGCEWVSDSYRGHRRSYEVCRDNDGYWRPYHQRGEYRNGY